MTTEEDKKQRISREKRRSMIDEICAKASVAKGREGAFRKNLEVADDAGLLAAWSDAQFEDKQRQRFNPLVKSRLIEAADRAIG